MNVFPIRRTLAMLWVGAAVLLTALLWTKAGRAEQWLMDGNVALGSGLQGGDPGTGTVAWTRARTRFLAGVDLRYDETTSEGYGVYGFAEIERRATFGGELRYERWITRTIGLHASLLGTVAPETMVGLGVGGRLGLPMGKSLTLFAEPGFAVFPLGSDLPGNTILLWFTLAGGISVPF
jgi:hypothetical protein